MADNTAIEWTDATWNPVTGCSIVSPGCTNCYAMKLAGTRLRHTPSRAGLTMDTKAGPVWTGEVRLNEQWLDQPLRWRRPRKIFVCAHGDLFAENVPDEWIDKVFAVMAMSPQHTFQVLTKRAARMRAYFAARLVNDYPWAEAADEIADLIGLEDHPVVLESRDIPLPNVWLGVSAERRTEWLERTADLRETPAAIRFVSAEPLLGDLGEIDLAGLHWIITGFESGNGARPGHPDWSRSIRDQCERAGIAYFHKQNGAFCVVYDRDRDDPDWRRCGAVAAERPKGQWLNLAGGQGFHGERLVRVVPAKKKAAGRLLDGVEHNGFPEIREVPFG